MHLSGFLPGIDMTIGPAPGSLSPVLIGGFGSFAIENGTINPSDGNIRAFDMLMGININATLMNNSLVDNVQYPGGALGGFSGSPIIDPSSGFSFGNLTSIAAGLGTGRIQVDFFEPFNTNFISQNVQVVLAIAPITNSVRLSWSAAATGYHLQTSSNLSTWSNLVENLPGPGTFTDPIANRPQQFYRLSRP